MVSAWHFVLKYVCLYILEPEEFLGKLPLKKKKLHPQIKQVVITNLELRLKFLLSGLSVFQTVWFFAYVSTLE